MEQIIKFKSNLSPEELANINEATIIFLLDSAKDIICDIRDTEEVEQKYLNLQVRIALELYNKMGIEGQTGHSENGISRSFSSADVSFEILDRITPVAKTIK